MWGCEEWSKLPSLSKLVWRILHLREKKERERECEREREGEGEIFVPTIGELSK
jgi:hypothetical protein